MIITRTPLRISLGGGGTDLPAYYENSDGGFLVAGAITKYVYVALHENFDDDILLKYSKTERRRNVEEIEHPLIRECLKTTGPWGGVEVASMADIPAGTGLGSSGAFAVGLLKALRLETHSDRGNAALAEEAFFIEKTKLEEPVGKQDQYMAALGGVRAMTISADGKVTMDHVVMDGPTRIQLEENLLLFFTGLRRSASEVLAEEVKGATSDQKTNLDRTKEMGYAARELLEAGRLDEFGSLMTDQWQLKYERQPSAVHDDIDGLIRRGIAHGASGGKLVGAGGGGFLLFYAEQKAALRKAMVDEGLSEVPFQFDYQGTSVIVDR